MKYFKYFLQNYFLIALFFTSEILFADSFKYNSYNNHGSIGLVNMPSARFLDESSYGITIFDGDPDQKITLTSSPFDWLEASFFYMNIPDLVSCREGPNGDRYCSSYKDKGFNFKVRIKEEGMLPAIAIGNNILGTGFYSSEYIVACNLDMHFSWKQQIKI